MRTHTTYDSDKLLCILRSVSPTCDNNEADPYAYMWIWDKERNLWLYILGFSSDYGAGTIVTLTHLTSGMITKSAKSVRKIFRIVITCMVYIHQTQSQGAAQS